MCLCALFQILARVKNIRILDVHFSASGRRLTHGVADPGSAADPCHLRWGSLYALQPDCQIAESNVLSL